MPAQTMLHILIFSGQNIFAKIIARPQRAKTMPTIIIIQISLVKSNQGETEKKNYLHDLRTVTSIEGYFLTLVQQLKSETKSTATKVMPAAMQTDLRSQNAHCMATVTDIASVQNLKIRVFKKYFQKICFKTYQNEQQDVVDGHCSSNRSATNQGNVDRDENSAKC